MKDPEHIEGLCAKIEKEGEKRRKFFLEKAADTETYLSGIVDYSDIISRIEEAF
jgi:hypothetical protein